LSDAEAKFGVGQLIHHLRFDYRGVVVDVDASFQGSDQWYDQVARSRPPKDRPWYHVLVDGAEHTTYVAERHLEADDTGQPIAHPLLGEFFDEFSDGRYGRAHSTH
jgi:heat shock protein HspQ